MTDHAQIFMHAVALVVLLFGGIVVGGGLFVAAKAIVLRIGKRKNLT